MQTLTSTPASMDPVSTSWPVSIPRKYDHRALWALGGAAAAAVVLVASISVWSATSDSTTSRTDRGLRERR
jgi:flagellar biosynthesis/type III secretory pathway M-ring protein FliF/YscJ